MAVFGFNSGAIQTANTSYVTIDFNAYPGNNTLTWPSTYQNVPFTDNEITYQVIAGGIGIINTAPSGSFIVLPNVIQGSVGYNSIITNASANSVLVSINTSITTTPVYAPLVTIAPGLSYWIQLTNVLVNAISSWNVVTFGAGTSIANAMVLAGYGLVAIPNMTSGTLNTNIVVNQQTTNYSVQLSDRASLILWSGGTGTITLPTSPPAGFYVGFNNTSTSNLTIAAPGSVTIQGSVNDLILSQNQTTSLIFDGTNWWTLGLGQNPPTLFAQTGPATPAITFANDNTTGIYDNGGAMVGVAVNGLNIARFLPSGLTMAANAGISTDNASATSTFSTSSVSPNPLLLNWAGPASAKAQASLSGTTTSSVFSLLSQVGQPSLVTTAGTTSAQIQYGSPLATAVSINNSGAVTLSATGQTTTLSAGLALAGAITGATTISATSLSLTTPLSVANGGTGATTLAANGILLGNGTSAITSTTALTNGQLLIGSTGVAPVAAVPTNGTNISWTIGAGTLRADLTATVPVSLGGTGANTLSAGDLLVGSGTSALTSVTSVATGSILVSNGVGVAPVYSTTLPFTLPIAKGGTGQTTAIAGLNALMSFVTPPSAANTMAYFNGTVWQIITPPSNTGTHALQCVSGVIGWS